MPRLHNITEIKFVKPELDAQGKATWTEPHGYEFKIVDEHFAIEAYAAEVERAMRQAQDQINICKELGHNSKHGCGGYQDVTDVFRCVHWLAVVAASARTPERSMLVRITIPTI